jgi:2-hydroxychromene-2-carboxylate isomerase
MARPEPIDFWFTMGSTYSYLTVMRLPEIEEAAGVAFRWRPFHLLTILQEMKHVPFADKPAKIAYMWRDIERRAEMYGIPLSVPAPYPAKQSVIANRVAILGLQEGWGVAFIRVAYGRWLQLGQETGSEPNLSESLKDVDQDPERVLALAGGADVAEALEAETSRARELGIFGSPTFAIGRELFWGDDRLDDAVSWHRHGSVEPPRGPHASRAAV